MSWTTFNPADLAGGSLSNGDLTFTAGGLDLTTYARAYDSQTTGKFYWEFVKNHVGADYYDGGGVCLLSAAGGDFNSGLNGAYIQQYGASGYQLVVDGTVIFQALFAGDPGTSSAAAIAVDLGAGNIWVRSSTTGLWNNNAGADPATGAGPVSLGALAGAALYPVVSTDQTAYTFTANFGATAMAGTVPAGFTAGWPGATPSAPSIPAGLAAVAVSTTTIEMGWSASTGSAPITYTLQYRVTGTTPWTQVTGITSLTDTVTGLVAGTFYDFQVEAVNGIGASGFSSTVVVETSATAQPTPPLPTALGGFRGMVGINFNGLALFGDAFSGVVGQADFETFTEYGNPMLALLTSPPIHSDRKRVFIERFELDVESGVGLAVGQGSDPQWMLDYSKDGGRTWSTLQTWRSMGKLGAYTQRLRWLRMGMSRQWILRLQSTDPVRRVIVGTYLDTTVGMG